MNFPILIFLILQLHQVNAEIGPITALGVIIKNGEFQFAKTKWVRLSSLRPTYELHFVIPKAPWDQIFHFCPRYFEYYYTALHLLRSNRSKKHSICRKPPSPVVMQVINPNEIKNKWNPDMEWYVSGYKIQTEEIKKYIIPKIKLFLQKSTAPKLKYKSLNEGEYLIPGLSIFYDKNIRQTRAVQYELLPSEYIEEDFLYRGPTFYEKSEINLDNFVQFFEGHNRVMVSINDNSKENSKIDEVQLVPLAPIEHFMCDTKKRIAQMDINAAPIWTKFTSQQSKINTFLETVALKLGKLQITSGVTKLGTLDDQSSRRIITNVDNNKKLLMPDYLWKVVQLKLKGKTYGIILVLINSLSSIKNEICEHDVCDKYNWNIRDENDSHFVHCCDMTSDSIKKLEIDYLELKENLSFDLKSLDFDKRK